jgi:transposase
MRFAAEVRELCAGAYSANGLGRPGIDPVVYFKMLMVGFFENLASERGIAERCQDSLAIRFFLGYDLTENTPDHSSLSVIRNRLGEDTYDAVFMLILGALQAHGLVKGRQVGIDASVIEANASLRNLVNRQTEEAYWDYVRRLAAENGVDPKDGEAVRQFDRKRPKKMSNQEWVNPHDPDAKIGPTKAGATDMIYKPEHTVDLDTGAILLAEVRLGHEPDAQDLARHVLEAQENINEVQGLPAGTLTVESTTADKGYHAVPEMGDLQAEGIRTVVSDPVKNRKVEKLTPADRQVVRKAKRSARSQSGKDLLRRRGRHIERTFAHILDAGGARRTTLCGLANLNKRYKLAAAIYNLSQLLRKLFGVGTPKQWAAGAQALFYWFWRLLRVAGTGTVGRKIISSANFKWSWGKPWLLSRNPIEDRARPVFSGKPGFFKNHPISTGC